MLKDQIVTVGSVNKCNELLVIVLAKRKEDLDGDEITLIISGRPIKTVPVISSPSEIGFAKNPDAKGFLFGWGVGYAKLEINYSKIPDKTDVSVVLSNEDRRKAPVKVCL